MWTPRRMILVAVGVLLFGGGFTLYSQLFGWIDGLPPLPDTYSQEQVDGAKVPELPGGTTPIQTRLRQAFGPNCVEQAYNLKFEAREKGLLFAASDAKILEDGRVLLQQMSIAVFGKVNREISTIHADRAWLTFEKPVSKLDDMGTNKLKSAELQADPDFPTSDVRKGKIHIINNRRTADPDDDMILRTPGPLYYREEPKSTEPHIWTLNSVELVDRQNRPLPSQKDAQVSLPTVTAEGLRVFLTPEPPKSPAGTPPKKLANSPSDSRGGVDRIELDRNVLMNIWTESRNMLGGGNEKNDASKAPVPKKATVQPADKVLLTIQTNGPFYYDMIKDFAHFEVPAQRDPNIQEYVKVTRRSKGTSEDTLTSDFLDVQFKRRRAATPTTPGQPPPKPVPVAKSPDGSTSSENDLDIETMHAWGKNIAVSSDEESLFAYGFDLVYDARIKQTTIKGAPMHAVKEGNLIRAPELIMANLDDKEKQHARARGPGVVGMGEFDPKTQEHGRQAYWQDWLIFTKVKEQGRDLDLITLSGSARFIDTLNEQKLNGRVLKLWMISRDDKNAPKQPKSVALTPAPKKFGPDGKPIEERKNPLPHRLEATGEVSAFSPEMVVLKSAYINVWFKDVVKPVVPPEHLPPPRDNPLVSKEPMPVVNNAPKDLDAPPAAKKQTAKKDPPMIVRHARRIEVWVARADGKNDLDKVHTEGDVVIHQDPTQSNERGIDIAGITVDVEHHLEGNYLVVIGNEQTLGEVHFDKVSIIADDIKIDQRDNTANVKGPGSMRMLSATDLKGDKLAKSTYIDVYWNDAMELDGPIRSVRYEGAVTAKQNDGKVLCEVMQVWLDQPLYLNQADRARETTPLKKGESRSSPKVEKVLCDQLAVNAKAMKTKKLLPVSIEDVEKVNNIITKYQNVQGSQIEMDNVQNKMTSIGPGTVKMFQAGSKDPLANQPAANPKLPMRKKADDEETKFTWVSFDQRMVAFNNVPKRAVFYSNVEAVHMPSKDHEVKIDIARLPEGAVHIRCQEKMEVTSQVRKIRDANGKEIEQKWQEMKAEGNVRVRGDDFEGWAGVVTFTEEKSLLVFNGTVNNPATLSRLEAKGGERKTFRGEKITYNVKTKDCSVDGSVGGNTN